MKFQNMYDYKVIKPKPLLIEKKVASSSLIRKYLQKGNLKKANLLWVTIAILVIKNLK